MAGLAFTEPQDMAFVLDGGADLVSSHLTMKPGELMTGNNFEMVKGRAGYSRPGGFERCVDDNLPSETQIKFFQLTNPTGAISVDDEFTSGDQVVRSLEDHPTPATGDILVVATHEDSFTDGITFTGSTESFDLDTCITDTSDYTDEEIRAFRIQAIEQTRTLVAEVPGTETIPGGFRLKGKSYTFRDGVLHRAISTGWETVTMPDVLRFGEGISEIEEGDIITDGTVTAEVIYMTLQKGSWSYSLEDVDQATGYFTLKDITGGSFTSGSDLKKNGATVPGFTNGDFSTDTDWTKGEGWSISGGTASCSGTQANKSLLTTDYVVSRGDSVEFTVITTGITAGHIIPILGLNEGEPITSNGTHTFTIVASTDTEEFSFEASSDFNGSIDSIADAVGIIAKTTSDVFTYSLPSGGKYESRNHNFTNLVDNESCYGVSGVGEAFQFDGENYVPIYHPDADTDTPIHIFIHQERLWLLYPGGEAAYSVSGKPRVFNALLGAGTYSTGSELVGGKTIHGNAAVFFCKSSTWLLTGTGIYDEGTATRDWLFFEHDEDIGAVEWSIAGRGYPVYASGNDLKKLTTTDRTGGYQSYDVAEELTPFLEDNVDETVGAIWARDKGQYRIFFASGKALFVKVGSRKNTGGIPITYPIKIVNVWREVENGKELIFFTSDTGYLYRMDSGNSFDDDYIEGSMRLPFYHYRSPGREKEFPHMILALDSPVLLSGDTQIDYSVDFNYASPNRPTPLVQSVTELDGVGGVFGENAGFGGFVWGGALVSEITAYLDGYGWNMSILVNFKTKYDNPFTFLTAIVSYIEHGPRELGA